MSDLDFWDNCAVADCPNKCCLRLQSEKCWPHTVSAPLNWADGLNKKQRKETRKALERVWRKKGEQKKFILFLT